jgi:hypothetical protein
VDLYLHSIVCLSEVFTASFVAIVTHFGLDYPEIESRWGSRDFSALHQTGVGDLPSLLYNGYRVILWVKAAGAWRQPFSLHPYLTPGLNKE